MNELCSTCGHRQSEHYLTGQHRCHHCDCHQFATVYSPWGGDITLGEERHD